jgi:hypothetical protein
MARRSTRTQRPGVEDARRPARVDRLPIEAIDVHARRHHEDPIAPAARGQVAPPQLGRGEDEIGRLPAELLVAREIGGQLGVGRARLAERRAPQVEDGAHAERPRPLHDRQPAPAVAEVDHVVLGPFHLPAQRAAKGLDLIDERSVGDRDAQHAGLVKALHVRQIAHADGEHVDDEAAGERAQGMEHLHAVAVGARHDAEAHDQHPGQLPASPFASLCRLRRPPAAGRFSVARPGVLLY